jgi:hypothetical protein
MCAMSGGPRGSKTRPSPSWNGLYALAGLMLGALFVVQALVAPDAERTALQCGVVLGGFATMVHWTRRNRAALDHLDWCDCADSRTTVRVVPSRQPQPAHARWADARIPVDLEPEETTLEEVSR